MTAYGAGYAPFGTGPAALPWTDTYVAERTQVTASRKVDANGRFVQLEDGTGGFVGETDVAHRVTMILGRFKPGGNISAKSGAEVEAEIRRMLAPLTQGREPVAKVVSVQFVDSGASAAGYVVTFKDLTDGQVRTLPVQR